MRLSVPSNRVWSNSAYSRGLRVGDRIEIAGTTATNAKGEVLCPGDMYGQAEAIFAIIGSTLKQLHSSFDDVVRTRIFTTDISRWEEIGRAHHNAFGHMAMPPVSAFYGVKELLHPDLLLEIEASAVSPAGTAPER
jgi:enamine deaminase RidA (YjgF/YER057c/UK114 family)